MSDYPKFTKDMRKTHTILMPSMLDFHFALCKNALISCGYKVEILKNTSYDVITEGLKYVHNDTCYPALLVIGQFIDALKYRTDLDKIVLLISQTAGGCRASNYIHLLQKALIKAGYDYIPVVSLNLSNLEKNNGLQITYNLIRKLIVAMTYGDFLMYLHNKTRSYEKEKGSAKALVENWTNELSKQMLKNRGIRFFSIKKNLKNIAKDFDNLELIPQNKPKVGIVGEIYIKFSSLGNNNLEEFLINEGAEILVPGVYGFIFYGFYNNIFDYKIYGGKKKTLILNKILIWFLSRFERLMINSLKKTKFSPINSFSHTKTLSEGIIGHGTKMGEGWLLTAEMMELIELGYSNIVCAQPFGCLPNHICGKGVMKKIKSIHQNANIVAVDYDPSATKVNQENRLKLMLAIAKENTESEAL